MARKDTAVLASITLPKFNRERKPVVLNPFFKTTIMGTMREDGKEEKAKAIVNLDTNETVGLVSSHYKFISHKEAQKIVYDLLKKAKLNYQTLGPVVSNGGGRYFETITFPDLSIEPSGQYPSTALDLMGEGHTFIDILMPTIIIRNSYDRTSPLAFDYGFYRVKCTNGLNFLHSSERLSFKHSQLVDADKVKEGLVANLSKSVKAMSDHYLRLNQESGQEKLIEVLKGKFSEKFKNSIIEHLRKEDPTFKIDTTEKVDPETGHKEILIHSLTTKASSYAIYNVTTDIASHEIGNRFTQEMVGKDIARMFQITG